MSKPRGRPTNRADLLQAAVAEFDWLWLSVDEVPNERREEPGACVHWSVKDLLAHLHAWQEMTIGWERAGAAGEMPAMPAEGYTFATTPALNEAIYARTRADAWADIVQRLRSSHEELLDIIASYDDAALFTKRRCPWTRSTSVGSYMVSATSSHYAWASKLIRSWAHRLS